MTRSTHLVSSLRTRGVLGTLRHLRRELTARRVPAHPFDLQHGTDTGGLVWNTGGSHPSAEHVTAYWGTAPSLLRGALERWVGTLAGSGFGVEDYSFVDVGCGKGRVLMIASEMPFRRVLGVELDAALVAVARRNLALWTATPRACGAVEARVEDVLEAALPDGPVLLYLFNPFDAVLMQRLADRLRGAAESRREPIDVLYVRPDHAAVLEAIPGMQTLFREDLPFSAEDTAADVFETLRQECFLYRLPGSAR